ncbi:hypothetical protein CAEBREN_29589 [Caenorhabditis brenneri]|uniref:Uncharacterized protein n=1 Tax=Caenorhabditis brenneri TaxID=135651 RepID=G0P6W0_CAEBE|nr:hypothetical protein CAEBREN_29589 [Caenorhabditis brenneri]
MRVSFVFIFLFVAFTVADDSFDEVKSKIQELIDGGFGQDDRERSSDKRSLSSSGNSEKREKKMKSMDWDSDDDFMGSDEDYESFYRSIYGDKPQKRRTSKDEDGEYNHSSEFGRYSFSGYETPSSRSRSSSSRSDSDSSSSSRSSSTSKASSGYNDSKNYYKNGKKKGFLGKLFDKVSKKLKSIPGKFAAGAAALSGKVVSGVASIPEKVVDGVSSVSGKVVNGVVSLPGKVVDGVKSIPEKAKSVLPGGKKKTGDITLNDYTQENHYHVHKDKHYHDELHRHQDDSTNLNVYNDWDGYGLNEKYGSIYDDLRFKRSADDYAQDARRPHRSSAKSKLHKKIKPSEKKALIFF